MLTSLRVTTGHQRCLMPHKMKVSKKSATESGVTLAAKVYDDLRKKIINGELAPGTSLVRRKVSKELGVSPIPVMEALWRLEQDGLVESEPMHGSRVRQISIESIKDEYILREAIECQAARVCAEVITDKQIKQLKEQAVEVDKLEHGGNLQSKKGIAMHLDFHLTIARCSGSASLVNELQRVGYRELVRLKWITSDHKPAPLKFHQELIKAIATKDPDQAEKTMRHHVRYGLEDFWQAMQTLSDFQVKE